MTTRAEADDDAPLPDPQEYLPVDLRRWWVVARRGALYWLFLQAALLGAGLTLTIGGLVESSHAGWVPGLLVALGVMAVNGLLIRRSERAWLASLPKPKCPNEIEV